MDAIEIVKRLLSKRVDISKLKPEDELTSIGLDSLDLVETMLEIEEELKVEFSSEEIAELKTLQSVIDLVQSKCK